MELSTDNCPDCGGDGFVPAPRLQSGLRPCRCTRAKADTASAKRTSIAGGLVLATLIALAALVAAA